MAWAATQAAPWHQRSLLPSQNRGTGARLKRQRNSACASEQKSCRRSSSGKTRRGCSVRSETPRRLDAINPSSTVTTATTEIVSIEIGVGTTPVVIVTPVVDRAARPAGSIVATERALAPAAHLRDAATGALAAHPPSGRCLGLLSRHRKQCCMGGRPRVGTADTGSGQVRLTGAKGQVEEGEVTEGTHAVAARRQLQEPIRDPAHPSRRRTGSGKEALLQACHRLQVIIHRTVALAQAVVVSTHLAVT